MLEAANHLHKRLLSAHSIRDAVMVLFPAELAKHSDLEGVSAVNNYNNIDDLY